MSNDILKMAVEITVAAIGNAGERASHIVSHPQQVAEFVETVYSKLSELSSPPESK